MSRVALASSRVIVAAAFATSCAPSRTLDPAATEPIRIGVVLSLLGDLGDAGQHRLDAVRLAAREVNAAGGLLGGRRVELVVGDGETNAAVGWRSPSRSWTPAWSR